jgi:uncharacterized protein
MQPVAPSTYVQRHVDSRLDALLDEAPAILLTGARGVGKTTTALRRVAEVARLDVPATATAWRSDPDAMLAAAATPLLIDEWQFVPEVLGAVKRSVDAAPSPGRFIVAGSAGSDRAPTTWPGTGRLVRLQMRSLTQAEVSGTTATDLVARLTDQAAMTSAVSDWSVVDYARSALAGGFPATATSSAGFRQAWLDSYIEQIATRDIPSLGGGVSPAGLTRFLEAHAAVAPAVVTNESLQAASGVSRNTADTYERRLIDIGIVTVLPPWWSNRLKRLTKSPKRTLTDTGLLAALLRVDLPAVLNDGLLLGRLFEAFVIAQIEPQVALWPRSRLHHVRTQEGRHEIDLLVEFPDGRLFGIEVKATAAPTPADARHLDWLAAEVGDRWAGGVVLCAGPRSYRLTGNHWAVPASYLWQ